MLDVSRVSGEERRTTVSPQPLLIMHDKKETAGITKNESDVKRNTFKCRAVLQLPTFSSVKKIKNQ